MGVAVGTRGSPVSDDGRGLKPDGAGVIVVIPAGSPVSDDGRGLKPVIVLGGAVAEEGSPVSDDGRGLKQQREELAVVLAVARPSAMTGVD